MSTIIPFGPQHPVLPEPIHFKLTIEDERVTEALPAIGYVHRGLEALVNVKDFRQMTQVVERVCGICSAMHGMCYCMGIEDLMGIEVPKKAKYLRTIWTELHRLHSHLLWFGLYADSFGFESLFMQFWRIRERIMDINEATAGSRVIISVNTIGGVTRDISDEHKAWILATLKEVKEELTALGKVILQDYTVKKRTVGVGVLTEAEAAPCVEYGGDCYARAKVRYREMLQSIDIVREAMEKMPKSGELAAKVAGFPKGEVITRVEQPRGECVYYIRSDGTKFLNRCRIRTPSFANIPAVTSILKGARLADVPVIILSMDPCISCTER